MDYTVTWPNAQLAPTPGRFPAIDRIAENLCHVHLPNGWTVSILQLEPFTDSPPWWETWPINLNGDRQTLEPEIHPTFDEAWDMVEHWAKM